MPSIGTTIYRLGKAAYKKHQQSKGLDALVEAIPVSSVKVNVSPDMTQFEILRQDSTKDFGVYITSIDALRNYSGVDIFADKNIYAPVLKNKSYEIFGRLGNKMTMILECVSGVPRGAMIISQNGLHPVDFRKPIVYQMALQANQALSNAVQVQQQNLPPPPPLSGPAQAQYQNLPPPPPPHQ